MTVNQEIKGNLAKLLATENLVIEHKKVPTAMFDVERRVLTLPIWNKASASVYDMLVGHEVGHALYTPNEDWTQAVKNAVPKDYVNVVEDARIEKLMKRKFPGLARSFYNGYNELNQDDFFCIQKEDLTKLSLIDRINLHFKIGAFGLIPFKSEEQQFIPMIEKAETFAEVLAICDQLVEFLKEQQQQEEISPPPQSAGANGDSDDQQSGQQDEGESEENDGQGGSVENNGTSDSLGQTQPGGGAPQQPKNQDQTAGGASAGGPDETQSKTQRSFDQKSEGLSNLPSCHYETDYVEIPEINLDNTIVDHKVLQTYIHKYWSNLAVDRKKHWGEIFDTADAEYCKYKLQSQKEVNYLVKEFECKKSADAYVRASVSKTGVLDTKVLHSYKYSEDIFKKVTVMPDGKNHGLIFILDWSGSMNSVIMDTVKQLLNLCWFCRKVQIPFEVYAFTYEWSPVYADPEWNGSLVKVKKKVKGNLEIHRLFSLLNFISSRANTADFEQQAKHLFRLAYYMNGKNCIYNCPHGLDMSGTPLNESIISLYEIIPQFKSQNKLQKVNVVILTDGEGANLTYYVNRTYSGNGLGSNHVGVTCALRDRKIGHVYRNFGNEYANSMTAILLENLKNRFPEVNLIGFRIIGGGEFSRFYRYLLDLKYGEFVPELINKQWKSEKSCEINPIGYDALYAISSSGLSADTSFEVQEDATTSDISKAFRGMLKKKTTNKKLLSSFATLVS